MPKAREPHACERCKREAHYLEYCDYCEPKKRVCRSCQKSSKTASKTQRLVICKTCWGNIKKRKAFKSA